MVTEAFKMVRKSTIGGLEADTKALFDMLKLSHRLNSKEPCQADSFMMFLLEMYQKDRAMDADLKSIIALYEKDKHFKKAVIELAELQKNNR